QDTLLMYTVTQPQRDASVFKGDTANFKCTFERSEYVNYYLFWYRQKEGDVPEYVLQRSTTETGHNSLEFHESRFDAQIMGNSSVLNIQDVRVSDSAVYYCALSLH
uniref:Ig-like domain-containing protein n=1 Tax=Neogobius melanostomus TaxID=47308 RepID=A0A8C6WPQ6_9GOBI